MVGLKFSIYSRSMNKYMAAIQVLSTDDTIKAPNSTNQNIHLTPWDTHQKGSSLSPSSSAKPNSTSETLSILCPCLFPTTCRPSRDNRP